jgi:transcriptional regulator with XRE-family HTH domain
VPVTRNALGSLLQERRAQQGYSRARVAEAVGISPGTIEGWEIGRVSKPPLTDVLRLARFLSIPLDEIEQAALADDDNGGREHERKQSDSGANRKLPGTTPLLEEAIRVMRWSDQEAADFLQTTPEQIQSWRRRSAPLPVADVLALTSVISSRLHDEMRGTATAR